MTANILVVDDEEDIRHLIGEILRDEGFTCREANGSDTAISEIEIQKPDLIILDIWLQTSGVDGLDLLKII